jgi:outer membrane protein TolC
MSALWTRVPDAIRRHLAFPCPRFGLRAAACLALLSMPGCASFSPDGGLSGVNAVTAPALGDDAVALRTAEDDEAAHTRVRALLGRPLTAAAAVRIALLNNRDLQAAYNALGISEAVMVQASLPPSPTFSLSRIGASGAFEIEGRIVASILNLATLPARADVAQDRFRQAQLQAALDTLRTASEARRAYYGAVAARALVALLAQARETGETAAELARRLNETGAINRLDQTRNQVFLAELVAQHSAARQRATAERERLVRALGLSGADTAFSLPGGLPPLPARARSLPSVETEALARRADLQMARIEASILAKSYGLTNATRFVSLLEAGAVSKVTRESGNTLRERGFEVELQIPLFDFGEAKLRQAEQTYMQAVNRLLAKAVNVRSEAREAYAAYRASYDIARQYRREVLPLRKIISDEMLLRYNAMQIDVFSLLTEARQRIASMTAAIEAERNFRLAEINLDAALIGGSTVTVPESTAGATGEPGGH